MAKQFQPTMIKLDDLINKLEVSTGSAHQPSPAQKLNAQLNSAQPNPASVSTETEKKVVEQPKSEVKPQGEKKEQAKKEKPKKEEGTVEPKPQKKKEEKKEKELAEPTIDDFVMIDIRVGEIKECWKHPQSDNLYCEKIDIGEEDVREIGSGLQQYVPIDQMSGLILVMANLKPRKLGGFMSNGMVMANSNNDHTGFKLVVPKGAKVGQRVKLQGFQDKFSDERQPELNPKKKVLQKCIGKFTTDAQGAGMWNGHKLKTSAGLIMCPIPNGKLS